MEAGRKSVRKTYLNRGSNHQGSDGMQAARENRLTLQESWGSTVKESCAYSFKREKQVRRRERTKECQSEMGDRRQHGPARGWIEKRKYDPDNPRCRSDEEKEAGAAHHRGTKLRG